MNSNIIKITNLLIPAYVLIAVIAFCTPLHSDDFGTVIGGFPNFPNHMKRYMEWSGRLTPDFLASFILWIDSHILRSLINAIGTFGVIAVIAKLPYSLCKKGVDYGYVLVFYVVMAALWLNSPNLGQTSFWIVGATNYIWTNLFLLLVINKLAMHFNHEYTVTYFGGVGLFILSLIAGCGNENMSLVLVGSTFLFILYSYIYNKSALSLGIITFLGSIIGAAILLGAPGNFRRMSMEGAWWKDATWEYRIWLWAYKKMPYVIHVDLPILAMIAFLLFLIVFNGKIKSSYKENKPLYLAVLFFIFISFIANLVLVGSPAYPPRATNGQFILLLCSFSFSFFLASNFANKKIVSAFSIIIISISIYAYTLMARAYYYVDQQEQIRRSIMLRERTHGNSSATIPEYHFRKLFHSGDKFDMFKPKQIPFFFGLKDVKYISPNFDFSVIKTTGTSISLPIGDFATGVEMWMYNEFLFGSEKVIVIQLDHYNKDIWKKHEAGFGLSNKVFINNIEYKLLSQPKLYAIDGTAYFALNIGSQNIPETLTSIK